MENKKITVAASGYFDPIHLGHIEYLELAKNLGDKLIVIVNSDKQAILKKGKPFMPEKERMAIIKALRCVDEVILSIDEDQTQCKTLEMLKPNIFAKGGDRFASEIPETPVCKKYNIKIVDGLGAKIQSSSDLIRKLKNKSDKISLMGTSGLIYLEIEDKKIKFTTDTPTYIGKEIESITEDLFSKFKISEFKIKIHESSKKINDKDISFETEDDESKNKIINYILENYYSLKKDSFFILNEKFEEVSKWQN